MQEPTPKSVDWYGGVDGYLAMLDQTKLPNEHIVIECQDVETVYEGIKMLRVRGAPAIGIAAAMGLVLGARDYARDTTELLARVAHVADYLASSRPTAVNLFWALDRMRQKSNAVSDHSPKKILEALLDEARRIQSEDAAMCRGIGKTGSSLIKPGMGVMTICNAGGLATAEYGTATAPMYTAHELGRKFKVYACETRPLLQGARLTSFELSQAGIDATVICDSMAGTMMKQGKIGIVITGADRIAANGDVANKIGTYSLAVLAKAHNIPFYVAAPSSTFDPATPYGDAIPIEERDPDEIRSGFGQQTVPAGVSCYNPAFDVTEADLIAGLITEKGLITPVNRPSIDNTLQLSAGCLDTCDG